MTNDLQQVSHQQKQQVAPQVSDSSLEESPKSRKNTGLIIRITIAIILLCVIICVAIFGASMYEIYTEKGPIESVLDAYMQHMVNKDTDSAYSLWSPRAQRQISVSEIEEMLEGNNYALFEDYRSLSVSNINISFAANTNPDIPQGTVAKVNGVVFFENGIQGSFNGTLEKVDDKWMIDSMYVVVPPNKIK